jgi:hypothetical protein
MLTVGIDYQGSGMSEDASAASTVTPTPSSADAEYDAICAALRETARGRWFLAEYARRNRNTDIALLLAAVERIESIHNERAALPFDHIRIDLHEMAKAIARTKAEIAAIKPEREQHGKLGDATVELDSIVQSTETATSEILAAAERVQETAWTMREQGVDAGLCDELDARATEIYMACEFQDLTGQRTQKVIEVLRYLEDRINAMIDIWGDDAPNAGAPSQASYGAVAVSDQGDIDRMMQPAAGQPAEMLVAQAFGDQEPSAPGTDAIADEFAELLFEPVGSPSAEPQPVVTDPATSLPMTTESAKGDMLRTPLDVVMPDWAKSTPKPADALPAPAPRANPTKSWTSPVPRPGDPLAPFNAMSDEEKIALFS